MSDRTEDALREALHHRGQEIRPTPALPGILHRAHRGAGAPSPWRRWAPAVGIGIAAVGLVAGAVVVVGGMGNPDDTPPVAGDGGAVPQDERDVTLYHSLGGALRDGESTRFWLAAETTSTTDSGDAGLDAVRALLSTGPVDDSYLNGFHLRSSDPEPQTDVASVSQSDGVITVDLTEDMWDPYPAVDCVCPSGEVVVQQLVWTVQDALDSDARVAVTVDGEPARGIWLEPLPRPVSADPYALAPILIDVPAEGATVTGPVSIAGTADVFEGNVQWEVLQAGEVVADGFTMGGTMGDRRPWKDSVRLPVGEYVLRAFEISAEDGTLFVEDTKSFTVE